MPDFSIEKKFNFPVIGLDEVGRGPLAGPVISCGCYFHTYTHIKNELEYINDSKKLSVKKRYLAFKIINNLKKKNILDYKLGIATVNEIDKFNILNATKMSMIRVLEKFQLPNATLIIDGNFKLSYKNYQEHSIIQGDQQSLSIATASIIAKIYRDRLMSILSNKFKEFNWEQNAGYGTKQHLKQIKIVGPTIHHRKSFEPIKSLIHNK